MEEENTRKHYLRFEKFYRIFGVKTEFGQETTDAMQKNDCSLKSWRTERAKRRVAVK